MSASGTGSAIELVRHPRARRVKLSVDPATGIARLTLPPRAAIGPALAWAEARAEWVRAQQARLPATIPLADGAVLPVDDRPLIVAWRADAPRGPRIEGDRLIVGGPPAALAGRIERWLRAEALRLLSADSADYAARGGVALAGVAVGDPRRRWGSCSGDGRIRFSWRLVLAPAFVRRATAAHEVAHRLHMDHSPAFNRAVARLLGEDPAPAMAWLRANGPTLYAYGRAY